jgi:signal transduction histidine kinase/ligand-binding sensor domain-containing protein
MRKKLNLLLTFLIGFLTSFLSFAQIKNKGVPSITQYSPADYKGDTQNWAILQDINGLVYFGNNSGLLEFDGVRWKLTHTPNKSLVRSLAMDSEGKIYVGAQNEFGYLVVNQKGEKEYKSLVELIPDEIKNFEGVPNIFCMEQGVLFHTLKGIYILDKQNKIQHIRPQKSFQIGYWVNGQFYTNEEGVGLVELETEEGNFHLKEVSSGEYFAQKRLEVVLPISPDSVLLKAENESFKLLINEKILTDWKTPFDDFYQKNKVYSSTYWDSPDGQRYFFLGTLESGLIIFDKQGKMIQHLHKGNGLRSNTIWAIETDNLGNLWLGLDDGVAYIALQSPFTSFVLNGLVLTSRVFEGSLYVGTTQGIFYKKWNGYENPLDAQNQFQFIEGTEEQAWHLQEINGSLICAHIKGIFEVKGNKAKPIVEGYFWKIAPVWQHPHTLIAGSYHDGLMVIEQKKGVWKLKNRLPFTESARYLETDAQGNVWISHPFKGIYKLRLNEELDSIISNKYYTTKEGLPSNNYNFVYSVGDNVMFSTEKGMYRYDDKKDMFVMDNQLNKLMQTDELVRRFSVSNENQIWYSTKKHIGAFIYNQNQEYQTWQTPFTTFGNQVVYHLSPLDDENVLIGLPHGLIHFNPAMGKNYFLGAASTFKALIRSVVSVSGEAVIKGGSDENFYTSNPLPYEFNHLKFNFASNWQESPAQNLYSCYLDGYDKTYSDWGNFSEKEYTNLPEGDYVFRVRSQNIHGNVSQEASFKFSIEPPFYRTWIAYCLYGIGSLLLVWGIVAVNSQRIKAEKEKLEELVQTRTTELTERNKQIERQNQLLAQQKEEIQTQSESIHHQNDSLKALNEEKNHLIGILAHDLRNPLHQIKMLAMLMRMQKKDSISKDDDHHLSLMEKSCDHLNDMIGKILDIEAIESQKIKMKWEIIALEQVAQVMKDSFSGLAAKKNIQLEVIMPENAEGNSNIKADRGYLLQVIENLTTNAIKFSPTDKRIWFTISQKEGKVRLEVKDEGQGISPEDMKKLFGKFQKLSARPTAGETSTGLGLSIVKKYVEAMGGNVWCESEQGKGATFILEFERMEKRG